MTVRFAGALLFRVAWRAASTTSRSDHLPATGLLQLAKLLPQLAAGVGTEQVARIEPVRRDGSPEHPRKVAGKIGDMRATPVPERPAIGNGLEGEHFFRAAVAVGRDDEDGLAGNADDDVVMELALRPVVEELVVPMACAQLFEKCSEDQRMSELFEVRLHVDRVWRVLDKRPGCCLNHLLMSTTRSSIGAWSEENRERPM